MATFKYVIKKAGGKAVLLEDGRTTIYVKYTHAEKSTIFSTGVRVKVHEWQDDQQHPVGGEGSERKNKKARECKEELQLLLAQLTDNNIEPSAQNLRLAFRDKKSKEKNKHNRRAEDVVKEYDTYLACLSKSKKKSTVRTLTITKRKLEKYKARHTNGRLTILDIDLTFYEKFKKFLSEEEGNSDRTVGNRVSSLKHFLNWYEDRGGKVHADIRKRTFSAYQKEQTSQIYLSRQELKVFSCFEFEEEHYKWAQDYFVLQCNTGMSLQDILKIRPQHIQADAITMTSDKSKKSIHVPLSAKAREILARYKYQLPKKLPHRYNIYLKEALKKAGIDSPVEIQRKYQGKEQVSRVPKYQVVSSKTAIKTFIHLALQAGVSPQTIAAITDKGIAAISRHHTSGNKDELRSAMFKVFDNKNS